MLGACLRAAVPDGEAVFRKKPIALYWWRWQYPKRLNFGDEITAPLVERITGRRVRWTSPEECRLVGAGSVLQKVIRLREDELPLFWGTGFISAPAEDEPARDVPALAVRGRLSRDRLSPDSAARAGLGDPGLLADMLVTRRRPPKHALGIIPHYKDADSPVFAELDALGAGVRRIDVTLTPSQVAAEIASCEAVLSSSLHGLIVSDSLGVPNLHLPVGTALVGGSYKFRDYYSAFEDREYRSLEPADVAGASLDGVLTKLHDRATAATGVDELKRGLVDALRSAEL